MFTRLLTGTRTLKQLQESAKRQAEELEALADQATKLLKSVRGLDEQLQELRGSHLKLRGKVYGDRTNLAQEPAQADSREARKAAALKAAGIRPGRPVNLEN